MNESEDLAGFSSALSADDSHLEANRRAWDALVARRSALCKPASNEELAQPLRTVDPLGWLGPSIQGWQVLCLAAGGGRHSALYAAAGANVTVVDLSPAMLELDREVARARGLAIRVVQASMEQMPMLSDGEFDLVIHPVSTCYVPKLAPVFAEVARILRGNGLYVSQHKQPVSLQASMTRGADGTYGITHTYYRSSAVPPPTVNSSAANRLRETGATEYLHRWEEIIGGICRSGFVIEDLVEPLHAKEEGEPNSFADRAKYVAPYVRIKARRIGNPATSTPSSTTLWLPC